MAHEITITKSKLEALAAKLDTLALDDEERLVLYAVFAAAAPDSEVADFAFEGYRQGAQEPYLSQGFMNMFQPGGKVGFGSPGSEVGIVINW